MSNITRSEAIKTLKEHLSHWERLLREHICDEQEGIDIISALKLAIADLETDEVYQLEYEQPKFCEDCIDREAVYYYISSHIHEIITESGTDKNAHTNAILRSLANGVKTMPSVLPKVTKKDLGVDAISRADALSLICDIDLKRHLSGMSRKAFKDLYNGIDELPSVTPQEPKTGHWISHGEHCRNIGVMPSGLGAYEWCSNCDCGIDVREWHRNHYNYCPNCGSYNGGDSNGNE